ncbi:MAG: DUF6364 family protein [Dehalococcoidia bacterium]
MQTKLTLRLDDGLIVKAKKYSEKTGKPLSQIVADYFNLLSSENEQHPHKGTPITSSLRGVLNQSGVSEEDYHHYLEEKYR